METVNYKVMIGLDFNESVFMRGEIGGRGGVCV